MGAVGAVLLMAPKKKVCVVTRKPPVWTLGEETSVSYANQCFYVQTRTFVLVAEKLF